MAVVDDVLALGAELERSYHAYVRGRLKFRVGQLVYVAFSLDETVMGFAFPKEERAALVGGNPRKFQMVPTVSCHFDTHAKLPGEPGVCACINLDVGAVEAAAQPVAYEEQCSLGQAAYSRGCRFRWAQAPSAWMVGTISAPATVSS